MKSIVFWAAMTFVVDGDTFHNGQHKIRLWGIDAPEVHTQAGREAKRALATVVEGANLHCVIRHTDRYGRLVAMCYVDGAKRADIGNDVACQMVRLGHAKDWPAFSRGYYRQCESK